MSEKLENYENGSSAKRRASNDNIDLNEENTIATAAASIDVASNDAGNAAAAAAASTNQSADILKLDIDCFEEVFDYLTLADLISIGKTCKRLNQIIGHILQQYYSAVEVQCGPLRIGNIDQSNCCIQVAHKMSLYFDHSLPNFRKIQSNCPRLKRIHFQYIQLTRPKVEYLKETLRRIEVLQIIKSEISGNIHETVLAFCPKIRRLSITGTADDSNFEDTAMDLFGQKYPTLEQFEFELSSKHLITELRHFLELNPNIRKMAISCTKLLRYAFEDSLMNASVQLNELAILVRFVDSNLCQMMKILHERGFYKRFQLYLHFAEFNQENVDQLAPLNSLVKLYLGRSSYMHSVKLANLKSLEEICIFESDRISDLDALAIDLPYLERIHFIHAIFNDIWTFISRSRRVKKIRVDHLREGIHFNATQKVINLRSLNREREKLIRAQKLTIYVKEEIYVATKWAMGDTDLNWIRLKRIESFEWEHDFEGFRE